MAAEAVDAVSWSIDLCTGFVRQDEVTTGSLQAVVRDLERGSWSLSVPRSELDVSPSVVDSVLVWSDDGQLMFDGFVAPATSGFAGTELVDEGAGEMVTWSGVDGWGILGSRLAWPDPSSEPPWSVSHDVRSGFASSVAGGFISDNLGGSALADRQVPLRLADPSIGSMGVWSARLQPLDALVARICREGGVRCWPRVAAGGELVVTFTVPVDRSATIVLSDQGDLVGTERRTSPAESTWSLAAGQGEGVGREFEVAASGATGLARRERLVQATSATSSVELGQIAGVDLADGAEAERVRTKVTESASQRWEWLVDYDVGDLVTVEVDEDRFVVPVTAVEITVEPGRQTAVPVLGDATGDMVDGLRRDVTGLAERFDRQVR